MRHICLFMIYCKKDEHIIVVYNFSNTSFLLLLWTVFGYLFRVQLKTNSLYNFRLYQSDASWSLNLCIDYNKPFLWIENQLKYWLTTKETCSMRLSIVCPLKDGQFFTSGHFLESLEAESSFRMEAMTSIFMLKKKWLCRRCLQNNPWNRKKNENLTFWPLRFEEK